MVAATFQRDCKPSTHLAKRTGWCCYNLGSRQPVVRVDLQGRLTTWETGSNFVWKLKAAANPSKEVYRAPARHYQCPATPNRRNIRGIVRDLQATGAFPWQVCTAIRGALDRGGLAWRTLGRPTEGSAGRKADFHLGDERTSPWVRVKQWRCGPCARIFQSSGRSAFE